MNNGIEDKEQLSNAIFNMIETISFGTVTIIIQDGKVIQLEKNEKIRLK